MNLFPPPPVPGPFPLSTLIDVLYPLRAFQDDWTLTPALLPLSTRRFGSRGYACVTSPRLPFPNTACVGGLPCGSWRDPFRLLVLPLYPPETAGFSRNAPHFYQISVAYDLFTLPSSVGVITQCVFLCALPPPILVCVSPLKCSKAKKMYLSLFEPPGEDLVPHSPTDPCVWVTALPVKGISPCCPLSSR